jgi:pantothenate synthetase
VRVTAQPSGFNGRQSTTIKFDRTLVMPSSVTLAERDMRQTKFLEQLISDLDKRVNEAVDQTPAIRG